MKRFILIILAFAMLAACLSSCNAVDTQSAPEPSEENESQTQPAPEPSEENESQTQPAPEPSEKNDPIDYTKAEDTPNVTIPYDMSLVADLYLAAGERAEADSIYLDVTDGNLTVEDILFDEISYVENTDVKYDGLYNCYAPEISVEFNGMISGAEDEKEVLTVMTRIAQQKNCYLLRSSTVNEIADYIAAYHIDGVCYLAIFKNNVVSKIYFMKIEYAEPVLTEGMEIKSEDIASRVGIGDARVFLTVVDGNIYNYGYLQKIKYYNEIKINIEWCRENLGWWAIDKADGMSLFEKMNEENGCFVIFTDESVPYHREFAIFVIDGVYYFIDVTRAYRRGVCVMIMSSGVPLEETE